ncbi:MAG: radical SAM protein, partial [Spirochaetes bacterium]|nr:radical SAM protein [Spirochaetota bacterium]
MELSKYNIMSKIKNSGKYFIINLLSGNADILDEKDISDIKNNNIGMELNDNLISKGYMTDTEREAKTFKQKYLEFIDSRETDEIQLFYVPRFTCNFKCPYCYQKDYNLKDESFNLELIDAFFDFIDKKFKRRNKYITIFGGEPLLMGDTPMNTMKYIIEKSNKYAVDIAIVTNGYHLADYIEILKKGRIREIQVTLDGTEDVHNKRRIHKSNSLTFDRIVDGIDKSLKEFFNINLRFIADRENIYNLPDFAGFCINKKWTKNGLFKTQIGRNYNLHFCQSSNNRLYSRISLYEDLYEIIKKNPKILEFHKPAFSVSKFLFENGKLPEPLFDSCPACKTEWAFDYTGLIYPCTANVGQIEEAVGSFYPEVKLDNEKIEKWQERDITVIDQCRDCSLNMACGGGCGAVSKETKGTINKPDCRPVKELLELGISMYFKDQVKEENYVG